MTQISPQERAERAAAHMWEGDNAARLIGVKLDKVGPGTASASLKVKDKHLNGHKICHGGIIFTLADFAFAFACNSHNQVAVAQNNSIHYLKPGALGETLTANATETARSGRNGVYDVTVSGKGGRKIAEFRGISRVISGQHFEENKD